MISYPARAAKALGYLKRRYNHIEIFVEDTSNHNMWIRLLQKLLPEDVQLSSVNMLGGRNQVINACRLDQSDDGRKKLYIIDGDFDFLLGQPKPRLKHLYRIRSYCVENLLVHRNSLVEIGVDSSPLLSQSDIDALLDYSSLIGAFEPKLRSLFIIYATAYQVAPSVQTVGHSVMHLTRSTRSSITLDEGKIGHRVRQVVREACKLVKVAAFRKARKSIQDRAETLRFEECVSGKDYLFPLIWVQLRKRCGYRGSQNHLKIQLAKEYHPTFEPFLARRILNVSQ